MVIRYFTLFLTFATLAFAEPSLAEVKQALSQNPALLESPQAQVMMQEKGVTASEVKQKVSQADTKSTTDAGEATSEVVENSITETQEEATLEEATQEETTLETDLKKSALAKRVNPFDFKTNEEIRDSLNAKQQMLASKKLTRYSKRFYANSNQIDSASLPTPDDYIISNGDVLDMHIYGDRDQHSLLKVQNDGSVDIAYIGPVKIGGMEYKKAIEYLESQLKKHFQNSSFNISMNKYSSIQVSLIGEVYNPGIYNLSSFATVKDLLVTAKGVNENGSIRDIVVKRNNEIVAHIDFYDLLFQGKKIGQTLLKHGDVVIIKKAKTLVSIDGYINSAAIFELAEGEKLSTLIDYASGMKPNASQFNIKVDRYSDNDKFETYKLTLAKAKTFSMQNGDSVYIYPLDFTAKSSVNIYGNILRPGSYRLTKSSTLNALLQDSLASGLKGFFLPQTFFDYALLKRYTDELHYKTLSFNLRDVISNKERVELLADDQIFIFSQNDIYANSYITTKGKTLVKSGKLQYIAGMTIEDAINASGIDGVLDDKVRVTTFNTDDFMPMTHFYSLSQEGNITLSPYDEIEVYDYYAKHTLEPIYISGEVINPTSVFYEKGMTLQNLINSAGGFTKKAYTKSLVINRYYIDETQTRQQKVLTINLEERALSEIALEPYDEVKISTILGWNREDYQTVTISGEVRNPKTIKYGKGITLDDLIIAANGLTQKAYTKSLVINRYYIDETQTRQQKVLTINLEERALSEIALEPYDEVKISTILGWNREDYQTVTILGEVQSPKTIKYGEGITLNDLIIAANGLTQKAYLKHAEIVRYSIDENQTRQREIIRVELENREFSDIELKAFDRVSIFTIPQWSENRSVTLKGEVRFPGSYAIESGETLSSVIERAGGFSDEAFIEGALFTRESIRENQLEQYNTALAKIKRQLSIYNAMPANSKKAAAGSLDSLNEVIGESKKYQPIGRLSIHLDENLTKLKMSEFDIVLQNQDTLIVPARIDTVSIFGEVFNPSSFVHNSALDSDDYIELASGYTRAADESRSYVIHADGTSEPAVSGWWIFSSTLDIKAGDTLVVPIYIQEYNQLELWDSVAKILSSFAITAAALQTIGVIE